MIANPQLTEPLAKIFDIPETIQFYVAISGRVRWCWIFLVIGGFMLIKLLRVLRNKHDKK